MTQIKYLKNVAFVFPGQSSQYAGMGKELAENFAVAKNIFEEANAALGFDIKTLCFAGPEEELQKTAITQPAILTVSIAAFEILKARGFRPAVAAGHSLGEYAACVAAGALDFMDAVRLVHARGKFMQNAVPEGEGAMAAVLGLTYEKVLEITACATAGLVAAANINSPGQVVISGEKAAVAEVAEEAQKEGARKVIPLAVSAPFHCSLMQPAADKLQAEFSKVKFQNASFPVVANVTGEYITAAEEIRTKLIEQVTGAVLWQQSVENMITQGIKVFVEMGPKRVLSGLIKKINAGVKLLNVEDQKSLDATLEELSKN